MKKSKIVSIRKIGRQETFNITMKSAQHNYVLRDRDGRGVVSKNSTGYGYITYQTAYLKTYYPTEFICAALTSAADKDTEYLDEMIKNFSREYPKLKISPPHLNLSKSHYVSSEEMEIVSPFISIKGFGTRVSSHLVEGQPYHNISRFYAGMNRSILSDRIITDMVSLDFFREFGSKDEIGQEIRRISRMKGKSVKSKLTQGNKLF